MKTHGWKIGLIVLFIAEVVAGILIFLPPFSTTSAMLIGMVLWPVGYFAFAAFAIGIYIQAKHNENDT